MSEKRKVFEKPVNVEKWPEAGVSLGKRDTYLGTDVFKQSVYVGDEQVGTLYSWTQPVQAYTRGGKPSGMKLTRVYAAEEFVREHHTARWEAIEEIVNTVPARSRR